MKRNRILFVIVFVIIAAVVFSFVASDRSGAPASETAAQAVESGGDGGPDSNLTTRAKDEAEAVQSSSSLTTTAAIADNLGFKRDDIQAVYEAVWQFKFQPGTEVKGRPRLIGKAANDLALIELVGTGEEIPRASIAVSFPRNAPQAAAQNSIFMAQLLILAAPDWQEGSDWLSNGITEAFQQEKVETTHDDLSFRLEVHRELGMVVFTVQSVESAEAERAEAEIDAVEETEAGEEEAGTAEKVDTGEDGAGTAEEVDTGEEEADSAEDEGNTVEEEGNVAEEETDNAENEADTAQEGVDTAENETSGGEEGTDSGEDGVDAAAEEETDTAEEESEGSSSGQ